MTTTKPSSLNVSFHDPTELEQAAKQAQQVRQWIVGEAEDTVGEELPGLAGRIIEHAGNHPGKYDPPVALSTHIINAIVAGLNVYAYDRVVCENGAVDEEETRLLIAALALHDANKYVGSAYDVEFDTDSNTEEVLDFYFEAGDDFGIKSVLPGESDQEQQVDIADIKWLIQRTETKDTRSGTRGESTRRVRGLERYCRIGDGFVSVVHREDLGAGSEWLTQFFDDGEQRIHQLQFTEIEQPILNDHLLTTVKELVETGTIDAGDSDVDFSIPVQGVVMGSSPNSVLYLGEPIDRHALQEAVEEVLMSRITGYHSFSAKTNWNAFEYDILEEVDIPFEDKHEIIADGYAETLRRGSGTDHEFENVPEEFREALPELAKAVFIDQEYEQDFSGYPALWEIWQYADDEYSVFSRKIGFLAETFRRWTGSVVDDVDPESVREEVAAFGEEFRDELRDDLEPDSEAGPVVIGRFFESGIQSDLSLPDGDAMCFLCGRPASREFKKGNNAFYKTQSHSRRTEPEGSYKRICPVCNLEHALLRDTIEDHEYSVGSDIKIAFVYYDEFVANLTVGAKRGTDRLVRDLRDPDDDEEGAAALRTPELVASSFEPQYHLQPFYANDENQRLREVRRLLNTLVSRGFKVVIGKPFTGFKPQDALFADLNPSRRQTAFGADFIDSYDDLRRVRRLFDIMLKIAEDSDFSGDREFLSIRQDGMRAVADAVIQETEWYESVREQAHEHFIDSSYQQEYMNMRNVAQAGTDLYGYENDSRHKKTKVFREAVDATLDGLNRGMSEEEIREHVGGQIYKMAQEDSDYPTTTEQAEAFVDALFEYLQATGSFNKESLSRRRNTLANTYLFAYDRLLSENHDDNEGEETTEAPT